MLLIHPNHKHNKKDCVFKSLRAGCVEQIEKQLIVKDIPSKIEGFIGRQKEMFDVVQNVMS